ncbi:Gfo/Idh/MocA family oxidoreductase [Roseateles sp. DAIF2]|uniref:Gfo/Idh/MocA family protein n=1 Tax=Roseateles sp. DAIF2 TaxID=2714952 RepID=UPI0018A2CE1C|nr:Gfo/Idh/MocA family oxidoreductase [Roseateles sp. DAIF2]QPF75347.1 Gfo/Idh/MocA family oxidoreductase [Roseateles sp. DAIF2]
MAELLNIGLIGLGVMGQRMLARLKDHPRLRAAWVWDANPAAIATTLAAHPHLRAADSAEALIRQPGLDSLYIATPPAAHIALSHAAFDAGLAVFCEKPLTVDFDAARDCIARIGREKQRAAVNFSLASASGLAALQRAFGAAAKLPLGALQSVQIELGFAAWPRPWQAGAGPWLAERVEGGFTREVLSHFVFVLQRVLGRAEVLESRVSYPADGRSAETALSASLRADGVPVTIEGRVGPEIEVPDRNRMHWRASDGEVELREWFGLSEQRKGGLVQPLGESEALRGAAQADQLEQWVALIEGRSHSLPGYAEALAVQETIEALLAGKT